MFFTQHVDMTSSPIHYSSFLSPCHVLLRGECSPPLLPSHLLYDLYISVVRCSPSSSLLSSPLSTCPSPLTQWSPSPRSSLLPFPLLCHLLACCVQLSSLLTLSLFFSSPLYNALLSLSPNSTLLLCFVMLSQAQTPLPSSHSSLIIVFYRQLFPKRSYRKLQKNLLFSCQIVEQSIQLYSFAIHIISKSLKQIFSAHS